MAGNSERKGAIRGSKKGPSAGTGGKNKKRLAGKGPTPKAEDRPYHAAAQRHVPVQLREVQLDVIHELINQRVKLLLVVTQFLRRYVPQFRQQKY
jgi:hypothetical protein